MPLVSHHNIDLVLLIHVNIPGDVINMDKYTLFLFSVDGILKKPLPNLTFNFPTNLQETNVC